MIPFLLRAKADRFTLKDALTLGVGLFIYVLITLGTIGTSSIWFDEAFGAYLIRFSYFDVARYTASDVHPPLYYWLLKAWSGLFGTSDVALRSLSVLFGMVALVFGWLIIKRWFGRQVAATALAFAVITPFFVRYGVEARMYTLVTGIGFAATYVLTIADRTKKTWQWVIYGILIGLGMLTHYYAILIWLTHWIWRATVYRSSGIKGKAFLRTFFSRGWIVGHVVGLLVFAPWIGALIQQVRDVQSNGFWIPPFTPATPLNYLTNVVLYLQQDSTKSWGAVIFIGFVIGLIVIIRRVSRRVLKGEQRNYFLLIAMLACVPPVLLLLLSLPPLRPSFVDRYVVPSSLAIGILVGVTIGLSRGVLKPWVWRASLVAGLVIFGVGVSNVYHLGNYNNSLHESNNTRTVVTMIRDRTPDAQIIANSPWLYYEAAAYSTPASPVSFIDVKTEYKYGSLLMLKENDLGKIKDLAVFEAAHPTFWYIGRPGTGDIEEPSANLKVIDSFKVNDTVSGQPAYTAVRYRVLSSAE